MPKRQILKSSESALVWQIPEYEYQPKDISWYWLSLIATIVLLAVSLWQKNFLFAVFIAVAFLAIISLAGRFPTIWKIRIDEKGISINLPNNKGEEKFYPMEDFESFDIHEANSEEYKELMVKLKSKFSPYLKINFYLKDENEIKEFLLKFIPQKEHPKSLADSLSKIIRF